MLKCVFVKFKKNIKIVFTYMLVGVILVSKIDTSVIIIQNSHVM